MSEPPVGAVGERQITVGDNDTAIALGSGDVEVLGTPRVVALLEAAAVAAIAPHLDSESTTVGTRIDIEHLAPSPVGSTVEAAATVTAANGRQVEFTVEATMEGQTVARGIHTRVRVKREGFGQPRSAS